MVKNKVDTQSTNELYGKLQRRHKGNSALVNGYRLQEYFVREQALVMSLIDDQAETFLDIACGSGLMTEALFNRGKQVAGIDFNHSAIVEARGRMNYCIQGDAFQLPFSDCSFDTVTNCQFLNQQHPDKIQPFLRQCYRVLKPGGRLVLVWRNGSTLIHRVAHGVFTLIDKLTNSPSFPVFDHPLSDISQQARVAGFQEQRKFVTFPLTGWQSDQVAGLLSKIIGASAVLVLDKALD